ncbi:hypothetical protein G4X40_16820 [Rhodococcus sp. D2-41]|uniref:hypothetical protein n=1 Tax=Speluncibacter jeojiensis TaxID=2710754 RepID=UPI00241076EF|nr:hypothetical protein [Rhodococcus sp. D2-41]MDG3011810.1 hypothetical protein [Rhodococcus sp. D2-41]
MTDGDRSTEQARPRKPPGAVHLALTLVPLVVLACIYYDWWPSRYGAARWADPLLFGAAAAFVLPICAGVWAIRAPHAACGVVEGRGRGDDHG